MKISQKWKEKLPSAQKEIAWTDKLLASHRETFGKDKNQSVICTASSESSGEPWALTVRKCKDLLIHVTEAASG